MVVSSGTKFELNFIEITFNYFRLKIQSTDRQTNELDETISRSSQIRCERA